MLPPLHTRAEHMPVLLLQLPFWHSRQVPLHPWPFWPLALFAQRLFTHDLHVPQVLLSQQLPSTHRPPQFKNPDRQVVEHWLFTQVTPPVHWLSLQQLPCTHWLLQLRRPTAVQATQLPLLQTMPGPHSFRFGALPVSMQRELPESQVVVPTLQAEGTHIVPAVQATQAPARHTRPWPQSRPSGRSPDTLQTLVPVEQEVVPALQATLAVHDTLGVQGEQVPLLQYWLLPHMVPLRAFMPVSMQTGVPVVQLSLPTWHVLVGVQSAPSLQVTQLPWLHTWFMPQALPASASPAMAHTGAPVVHSILPSLQGWPATSQGMSAWQATHSPVALQTLSAPQPVPAGRFFMASVQVTLPPAQLSVPSWQGLAIGTQASPSAQVPHAPSLQTMPGPQLDPLSALPVSRHSGFPLAHSVMPLRQTVPGTGHSSPRRHIPHVPSIQTESVPHGLPLAWGRLVSMQVASWPLQTVVPMRHGLPATTQSLPVMHSPLPGPLAPPMPIGASVVLPPAPPLPPGRVELIPPVPPAGPPPWRGFSQAITANPSKTTQPIRVNGAISYRSWLA
jgi:hypothetical protein